ERHGVNVLARLGPQREIGALADPFTDGAVWLWLDLVGAVASGGGDVPVDATLPNRLGGCDDQSSLLSVVHRCLLSRMYLLRLYRIGIDKSIPNRDILFRYGR